MTGIWRLRAAVLILVGAVGVHHARYAISPPEHAHELAAVHAYMTWLVPLTAALLFVTVLQLGAWLHEAGRSDANERPELPSAWALWLAATATLVNVFALQETVELSVAHDQIPALAELLEHLGWQTVPLVVACGGALALLLKGAAHVVCALVGRMRRKRSPGTRLALPRAPMLGGRGSVLARHLAGRGPPPLS